MKLKPLQVQQVVEEAANAILDRIVEEELKPGDLLPSQGELSFQLGIGRSSIREAVQRLVVLGVVKVEHGRRMAVGNAVRRSLPSSLDSLRKEAWKDLLEVRALLEPEMAALAAQRATAAQIETLENIVAEMENPANAMELLELNRTFHRTLAECTQNKAAERVLLALEESSHPLYQALYETLVRENAGSNEAAQHRPLLQALQEKDSSGIRTLMQHHSQQYLAQEILLAYPESGSPPEGSLSPQDEDQSIN
jgi:GntR family transcriptional regulator, transcriptional repressor for pyruvate dehydrogenase complex